MAIPGASNFRPINIGGINFNENDILQQSSVKNGSINGQPAYTHTVETKHGIFKFRTQVPIDKNQPAPSIMFDGKNVNITNCNLFDLKGTAGSDSYVLDNSQVLQSADLADGKQDVIVLQNDSRVRGLNKDANDAIVDMNQQPDNNYYIPHSIDVKF